MARGKRAMFLILFISLAALASHADEPWEHTYRAGKKNIQLAIEMLKSEYLLHKRYEDGINLARLYIAEGLYDNALGVLRQLPDEDNVNILLGITSRRRGDYADALFYFEKVKDFHNDIEAIIEFAKTAIALRQFNTAKAVLEKARAKGRYKRLVEGLKEKIKKEVGYQKRPDTLDAEKRALLRRIDRNKFSEYGYVNAIARYITTLSEDGVKTKDVYVLGKVLTERGKNDVAELVIQYDATNEKVDLHYARTISPDGDVVEASPQDVHNVSIYNNFPMYSNYRAYIVSLPNLEVGSVYEYSFSIEEKGSLSIERLGSFVWGLLSTPHLVLRQEICLPKGLKFSYRDFKGRRPADISLEPKIVKEKDCVRYIWEFKDTDGIVPEPNMPGMYEIAPYRVLTTIKSWDDVYEWWKTLVKDKIQTSGFVANVTRSIVKGLKTDREKAAALYDFCAKNIRYVGIEYGKSGYEPHYAEEVLTNKYGDCKDQAILLVSMLRSAGIKEAWPVLISTLDGFNVTQDFPVMFFNHAIVAAKIDGSLVFMDPTDEASPFGMLPYGDQDRVVLVFEDDGYELVRTPVLGGNEQESRLDITVEDGDAFTAKAVYMWRGELARSPRYWFRYASKRDKEQYAQSLIKSFTPETELIDFSYRDMPDEENGFRLNVDFRGRDLLMRSGRYRLLPEWRGISLDTVALEKRRYDMRLYKGKKGVVRQKIVLPAGYKLVNLPPDKAFDTKWFSFHRSYSVVNEAPLSIESLSTFEYKVKLIEPEEYPEFRKALIDVAKNNMDMPLFVIDAEE